MQASQNNNQIRFKELYNIVSKLDKGYDAFNLNNNVLSKGLQ